MCVIIFIPTGETISKEELKKAWNTNPHGAGYCVQTHDKVKFHRGFMTFKSFYNHIKPYIGGYNLILHFRISTSDKVNQVQTHPYKVTDITSLYGFTTEPVACMNGTIPGQYCYFNKNDTMSFIKDYKGAFKAINSDVLELIADSTGAKWAVMTPDKVYISSEFQEHEGKYYSNLNHIRTYTYYVRDYSNNKSTSKTCEVDTFTEKPTVKGLLNKGLYNLIKNDKDILTEVREFIHIWRYYPYILDELTYCRTIEDLNRVLNIYY